VRILGVGLLNYLMDQWHYADLAVVMGSCVSLLVEGHTIGQLCRLLRVLQIVKAIPAVRTLFVTLMESLQQFLNVMALMFCVFSLYALVMTTLLSHTREGFLRLGSPVHQFPADPPNFRTYGTSMYTLFRIVQSDEWHYIMHDIMVAEPYCTPAPPGGQIGDCGISFTGAVVLLMSFKLLAEYMLLNLFIGTILDTFLRTQDTAVDFHFSDTDNARGHVKMGRAGAKQGGGGGQIVDRVGRSSDVCSCWERFSGGGGKASFMKVQDLPSLLRSLPQPLGYARDAFGEPIITAQDRAVGKLIGAELNLLAVYRNRGKEGQGRWRAWLGDLLVKWSLTRTVPRTRCRSTR